MWHDLRAGGLARRRDNGRQGRRRSRRLGAIEALESRQLLAGDLVAQWRAQDLEIPTGAPVETWLDSVHNVAAERAFGTPQFVANQLGGRSVVRFDETDGGDALIVGRAVSPLSDAEDFSIVVAFASSADFVGENAEWFKNTGLVDANNLGITKDWGISINQAGAVAFGMGSGFATPSQTLYSTVDGLNDGQLHVVSVTRSGSKLSIHVDDQAVVFRADADAAARGQLEMAIGGLLSGSKYFTGDIAEIRVYDGELDSAEVQAIHDEVESYYNNQPPVAVDDRFTTSEDQVLTIGVADGLLRNDADADGDTLTAILESEPSQGRLDLAPDGSFSYTPNPNFSGVDQFTYHAHDFRPGDAPATVTIQVQPVHDPPAVRNDFYKAVPTTRLTVPAEEGLLANDSTTENVVLSAVLVGEVSQGDLQLNADGSFAYDPQGFAGSVTFSYAVDDGVTQSNPATVLILSNTPPIATPDVYLAREDEPLIVDAATGVTMNDVDPDAVRLSATVITQPSHGSLTFNLNGSFRYEPNADYFGPDEFSYRVSDGVDESGEALVSIEVDPVNDPPFASADAFFVAPDMSLQVPAERGVLVNDHDIDDSNLSATLVRGPENGQLDFSADGAFTYTPNTGFEGRDQFSYRASDGTSQSADVVVSMRITQQPLIISEFMASNASTLETTLRASAEDEFEGEVLSPDWIEIRNLLSEPLDMGGLHLTDDAQQPMKWQIPPGTVIPGLGHALIFASGEDIRDSALDEQGIPHTNFQLSTEGEYLAITDVQGRVLHEYADQYPLQRTHVTFGVPSDNVGDVAYFQTPTPGAPNGTASSALVSDTKFSVNRGYFSEPFQVEITTATDGAIIRYTTDGTAPTTENGTDYTGPLRIERTTTLRAAAFKPGLIPANTDTQTYFFLDDIVEQDEQSTLDAGFPRRWRSTTADYGLDDEDQFPRIAGDETMSVEDAKELIKQSLTAIPSMSIVMNLDDMFGDRGIYSNPERAGRDWERPTSVELIHPDGTPGFQIDSGIRIQGGAFRGFGLTKKKSLRLLFKTEYGPSKLQYPLFGEGAVDEFDTLTLRMEANDGWQWSGASGQPQYARDEFLRRVQLAMGQPASHGTSIHLYINGMYWGLYNIVERPDQGFAESYFGVDAYSWDGINSGTPINASDDRFRRSRTQRAWRDMQDLTRDIARAETQEEKTRLLLALQGLNPDGTDNPDLEDWLDLENMIDYLIVNYYGHNSDWPFKNYYVGRENGPDSTGFKFFMWDAEWSLFLRSNVNGDNIDVRTGVAAPFQNLRSSDEFRVLFGDRVQKHFFNGGVFYVDPENPQWDPEHPERNMPAKRYVEWTDFVFDALIAESARWGDQHRARPYVRDVEWQREFDRIIERWFPDRSAFMIERYQQKELFPTLQTAAFNQRGGAITSQFDIDLSAPEGTIYYTTDGSDPRTIGGAVSESAIRYAGPFRLSDSGVIKVRVLEEDEWSAIDEASFVVDADIPHSGNLRVSELHYHPADPTEAEQLAGFSDADEFEFIELVNIGDTTLDLSSVRLKRSVVDGADQGVDFDFSESSIRELAPGARVLVVENSQAFVFRYGSELPVAGQWAGGLSNRSEQITVAVGESILQQFTYQDDWYPQADGQGPSLELIDPTRADLDAWSQRQAWRVSGDPGGSPGREGSAGLVPGDSNRDGQFDSSDLVLVFQAGEFEDSVPGNSTFEDGDWNGDGEFDSSDLVFAFKSGRFVTAAVADHAIHVLGAALARSHSMKTRETAPRPRQAAMGHPQQPVANLDRLDAIDSLFAEDSLLKQRERDDFDTKLDDDLLATLDVRVLPFIDRHTHQQENWMT